MVRTTNQSTIAIIALCFSTGSTAGQPQKSPPPLPAEIVTAWEKAGAEVGWLGSDDFGYTRFRSGGGEGNGWEVPAFKFKMWPAGKLGQLPEPPRGFGLSFSSQTTVPDAGLKELAGLKTLKSLSLENCLFTDAGLMELAGLKSLQVLDLGLTEVSDVGLKEVAGVPSLRHLDLTCTKVTDAGLKVLARLKDLQPLAPLRPLPERG